MEEWRPVYEFPDYEVSSLARVRRVTPFPKQPNRKFGIMAISISVRGYCRAKFAASDGTFVYRLVHNIMAKAFLPNPGMHTSACHNNGIKTDNRLENLRWDSVRGNVLDREKHGTENSGERNGSAKLTAGQVLEIRKLRANGARSTSLAGTYGVSHQQILKICKGEKWKYLLPPDAC